MNYLTSNPQMFEKIKESFHRQGLMQTLNARLTEVQKGQVKISCVFSQALTQQHGYFHAGVAASIADSACGYAALTMMPEASEVLTVEFKVNFLKPAKTHELIAIGKVLQSGRTLIVCEGYVYDSREEILIAKMTATIFTAKQLQSQTTTS